MGNSLKDIEIGDTVRICAVVGTHQREGQTGKVVRLGGFFGFVTVVFEDSPHEEYNFLSDECLPTTKGSK